MGEAPTKWTRTLHFSDPDRGQTPDILIACCPWHDGAGHFLAFYLCKDYWSLLGPLQDLPNPPPSMQAKLHGALRESLCARNLPVPDLP
jgi:hypothetical protein